MPINPALIQQRSMSGVGTSPTLSPSPDNLLMAATEMDKMGKFDQPVQPKAHSGSRRAGKKLSLVR